MRRDARHVEHRHRHAALTAALALTVALVGCGTAEPDRTAPPSPAPTGGTGPTTDGCATTGVTRVRDVVYAERSGVDSSQLSLDLAVPDRSAGCPPVPVVVYVHGGGFGRGDKANGVDTKVTSMTAEGWAFAAVNYRLVGDPGSGGLTSPHPGQADDVAAALAHLADHADRYGIDGERLALLGHSAGAFLVAQVGADERFLADVSLDPTALRCVVPVDTEGYDVADNVTRTGLDIWDAAFPDPAQHADASPLVQVTGAATPRSWLIVARGTPPRLDAARRFADAIEAEGGTAGVLDASAYDHEGVNDAIGDPADDVVTPALVPFLHGCLATQPPR